MMVTTKFLVFMLLGALPLIFASIEIVWLYVGGAYEAALFALLAIDAFRLPAKRSLYARRSEPGDFTLGIPRRIRLEITNESLRAAIVSVKDTPPLEFEAPGRTQTASIGPTRRVSVDYRTVCHTRGTFAFGDIYLRARTPLGLAERQYKTPAAAPVRVMPDVKAIARRRLSLELGSRVLFGRSRSRYIQAGTDFARHREYAAGDDYRHISWKATARRNKLITREFEAERSQTVFIMLDAGRMMTTRIGLYSRMDYSVNAALQLAAACIAKGDLVGISAFSSEIRSYLPPRRGRAQWGRIVEFAGRLQPDSSEPDYGRAYSHFRAKVKRRSLVVTFTDLANLQSGGPMVRHNLHLAGRHLPLIVSIADSDIAAEALRPSADIADVYRRAVAAELIEEAETILATLENRGVLTVHVPADTLSTAAVNRYLEVKYRGLL